MLSIIHSHYRPILLTLLTLLGLACGHLAGTVLQAQLRPAADLDVDAPRQGAATAAATTESDLNRILRNNLFDPAGRSATASIGPKAQVAGDTGRGGQPARSDLKLIGTVVAGDDSLALLEIDRKLQIYRLGADLAGGGVIETIERNRVTMRNRDRSLTTLILHEPSPTPAGAVPARPATQTGGSAGEIRAVGANRWLVSRDLVESVRDNFAEQLRLAQMQPRLVDGKTDGFLVQRINPRSILARMGLRRGDVVIDVNSIKLDSPEKALQIFQQLREARRIDLAIERNGAPASFHYEVN